MDQTLSETTRKPLYDSGQDRAMKSSSPDCAEKKQMRYLNFGQALQFLKEGAKVKRANWRGYWFMSKEVDCHETLSDGYVKGFKFMKGLIVAVLADNGGVAPAQPYQSDLLAEDWGVV